MELGVDVTHASLILHCDVYISPVVENIPLEDFYIPSVLHLQILNPGW